MSELRGHPCDECGEVIKGDTESPWGVVMPDLTVKRFCGVQHAKVWLDREAERS